MNDELSDDIKKKFMLILTIELQDHKEKVFHKAPVSPAAAYLLFNSAFYLPLYDPLSLQVSNDCAVSSFHLRAGFKKCQDNHGTEK